MTGGNSSPSCEAVTSPSDPMVQMTNDLSAASFEVLQDFDHRADARAEHHAQNQNHHDVLDAAPDGHDGQQHQRRAEPRRTGQSERLHQRVVGHTQQRRPSRKSATPRLAPELTPST